MIIAESDLVAAALAMPAEARARLARCLTDSLEAAAGTEKDEIGVTEKFPFVPVGERTRFWVRPPNAELDRAGEWLVKNLDAVREETIDRGEPL